jgi:5-methylcytosine-specific restriction protein A
MQLIDDDGRILDAGYLAERDGSHLAVIMDSRRGSPSRNPDYNRALTVLLTRLGQLNAVLVDAVVDSRHTQGLALPESDRRLIDAPIRLAREPNPDALRRQLGIAQARVGRSPQVTKGGNSTKRIRLRLDVPGYSLNDAARLAAALAAPVSGAAPMFILTWHPLHYRWEEHGYDEAIQVTAAGQVWSQNWTVGSRKGGITPGDTAILYRQHQHRGLVASGVFTSGVEIGAHWEDSARAARLAQIDWNTVLDYEDCLPVDVLKARVPEVKWDRIQGSGVAVERSAVPRLTELWAQYIGKVLFHSPDEPRGIDGQRYPEGALSRVEVNRYERDARARKACLNHHGYRCVVCRFSFEERYGPIGRNYIHVHHTLELSKVPRGYRVDPITDLVPLCPNCHAMIHQGTGRALTVDELKRQLRPVNGL